MPQSKLDVPASTNTVRVRMVDTTVMMVLHAKSFLKPVTPGHETMNMTDMAFLIENDRLGRKAMFDLGTRKDYWNLPPAIQARFDRLGLGMKIPKDVKDILTEKNIQLDFINDIIWSHSHWDHTGDTTLFPPTTNLVYGPEISTSKPGHPVNPDSPLPDTLFHNRANIEISFPENDGLTIGGFPAHDFYGDASFYLLSTPGHAKGHLCALARTTPDTFVLMGGDVCHFAGDLRPNPAYPMPDPIPEGVLDRAPAFPNPCPASFFLNEHPQFQKRDTPDEQDDDSTGEDVHTTAKEAKRNVQRQTQTSRENRNTTPYYLLSTDPHTAYDTPSPQVAQSTIQTLITHFDSAPNVFVCLAHDPALLDHLPTLNSNPEADLNRWLEKGWKEECYWGWLNEVGREGKRGRKPIVEGWWRGGEVFGTAKQMLEAFKGKM